MSVNKDHTEDIKCGSVTHDAEQNSDMQQRDRLTSPKRKASRKDGNSNKRHRKCVRQYKLLRQCLAVFSLVIFAAQTLRNELKRFQNGKRGNNDMRNSSAPKRFLETRKQYQALLGTKQDHIDLLKRYKLPLSKKCDRYVILH